MGGFKEYRIHSKFGIVYKFSNYRYLINGLLKNKFLVKFISNAIYTLSFNHYNFSIVRMKITDFSELFYYYTYLNFYMKINKLTIKDYYNYMKFERKSLNEYDDISYSEWETFRRVERITHEAIIKYGNHIPFTIKTIFVEDLMKLDNCGFIMN